MNSSLPTAASIPDHILVVEDDPATRALLCRVVQANGWRVEAVASAAEALKFLAEPEPDLVVLDLGLPHGAGFQLLSTIRSTPATRTLPVIGMAGVATLADGLHALATGMTEFMAGPFDAEEFAVHVRASLRLRTLAAELEEAEHVIFALAGVVDARDPYTAGHSDRVAATARMLGERIGLPASQLVTLWRGARLHDIGKIAVPDGILRKPAALTPEEIAIIRRHPADGWRLLEPLRTLTPTHPIVLHHHERMDGSGYPLGLSGDTIPLMARITAVADVYDALVTDRPYRKSFTRERALDVLEAEAERGWWDRDLVAEFRAMMAPGVPERVRCPDAEFSGASHGARS